MGANTPATTVNNQLAGKRQSFSQFISGDLIKQSIMQTLQAEDVQRFITSTVSLVSNNPPLAECNNNSIILAALQGAALKLSSSPQLGQFYLVPFNDKNKGKVATFQLGYKGYIQLAIRSGYYKKLNVVAIKQGELVEYDFMNEEIVINKIKDEAKREATPAMGYYAVFEYTNGFRKTLYWSKEKMEAHATEYSQGYKSDKKNKTRYTFWSKDFDGMAYKTMLRQLISKWGIMSIEMQDAISNDMTFKDSDGTSQYVETDNGYTGETINAEYQEVEPETTYTPPAQDEADDDFFEGTPMANQ